MRLHFTSDGFVLAVSSPGKAGNACLAFISPSRCLCLTRQRALAGEVSGSRWGLPSAPLVLASVAPQLLLELYPVRGLFHSRVARLILKKKNNKKLRSRFILYAISFLNGDNVRFFSFWTSAAWKQALLISHSANDIATMYHMMQNSKSSGRL